MTSYRNISVGTKGKPSIEQLRRRCRKKLVESVNFLPGLFINKPPAVTVADKLANITHAMSGYAIVQHLPIHLLAEAKTILSSVDWRRSSVDIYNCPLARAATTEVKEIMASDKSKEQEKRLAKLFGGKVQPGSGRIANYRRDVVSRSSLVEAKITSTDKYVFSLLDFDALKFEAKKHGKLPVYVIEFENIGSDGHLFCVLDFDDFFIDPPTDNVIELSTKEDAVTYSINRSVAKDINMEDKLYILTRAGGYGRLLLCNVEVALNLINED